MMKYNVGSSIPVDSLSETELKIAIKEWSEGVKYLEELLWTLYNKGVKTSGCHAGSKSYIGMYYSNNSKEIIAKFMDVVFNVQNSQILISPDGGNPLSGPNWDKPGVNFGASTPNIQSAEKAFSILNDIANGMRESEHTLDTPSLINLTEFLSSKKSLLTIRINHNANNEFVFSVSRSISEDTELFKYLSVVFNKLGFNLIQNPDGPIKEWTFTTNDTKVFNKVIKEFATIVIETYDINPPTVIDEKMSLKEKAHILKSQAPELFDNWLKAERERLNSSINEKKEHHTMK